MRNKAIYLATLLCVPAAAVLIANAPVAAAETACYPANVVRTAAQAGDLKMACTPENPNTPGFLQQS